MRDFWKLDRTAGKQKISHVMSCLNQFHFKDSDVGFLTTDASDPLGDIVSQLTTVNSEFSLGVTIGTINSTRDIYTKINELVDAYNSSILNPNADTNAPGYDLENVIFDINVKNATTINQGAGTVAHSGKYAKGFTIGGGGFTHNTTDKRIEFNGTTNYLQHTDLILGQPFNIIMIINNVTDGTNRHSYIELVNNGHTSKIIWSFESDDTLGYWGASGGFDQSTFALASGVNVVFYGFSREYNALDYRCYDPVNGIRSDTLTFSNGNVRGNLGTFFQIAKSTRFADTHSVMHLYRMLINLGRFENSEFDALAADLYTYHTT